MKPFTSIQEKLLLALAAFGFAVPNGCFLYVVFTDPATFQAALANPIALVFIAEAFLLMFLGAWLIHRWGVRSPGWKAFIVLSLIGSLAFSIPTYLWLASRSARAAGLPKSDGGRSGKRAN